ncbi:MAG TPA: DUF1189 family protein [Thermodesulfovibrionales bacterium]|nr:DUF1189 family protein [Thermodesulfovibrionales bacterium]
MQERKRSNTFTIFQTLYLSFFSRPLYQDIRRNWNGIGLPYLLLILMIFWVPEMMNVNTAISGYLADEAPQYVDQIPVITIKQGKASVSEPVPLYIMDRKKNVPVAIIDTSGQTTSLEKTPAVVLLMQDRLLVRHGKDSDETRSFSFTDTGDITVTPKLIYNWLEVFNSIFVIVLFPFVLLVSFAYHVLQTVLLTFLGNSFAKYFSVQLDFRTLFRLSAVAFTPAIMLETVHAVLNIDYPYSSFFSFLITSGYLFYAVGCNSEKTLLPIKGRT